MTGSSKSPHKQMAVNMASSVAVFAMNLCVSFFLTPFIVSRLGTAAYGFVGLTNNIIGYTALLTVAVNSMAGRFVTVKVHEGNIKEANIYLSSVFFANVILSAIIMAVLTAIVVFLPELINVPSQLLGDVRTLFSLIALSTCMGLLVGIISVSTFICNRLDYSNLRSLVGTVIRVVLLLLMFGLLPPRLWYIGISVVVMEIYGIVTNYWFFRHLTPELAIKRSYFDFRRLKEVTMAGAWNVLNKLSEILSRGLDLLLANIFIGATAMGQLSLSQTLPVLVIGFVATIAGNFAPEFTRLYARGESELLRKELLASVRISSLIVCIPLSIVYAYSDVFYSLWLPSENAGLLYGLTLLGSFASSVSMPQEPLWNIFTITNKVRQSSLNLLFNSVCSIAVLIGAMFIVKNPVTGLFIIAGTRTLFGLVRCLTFLPNYGAKCLGFPAGTFYPAIARSFVNILIITALSILFKGLFMEDSWLSLFAGGIFTAVTGLSVAYFLVLKKSDREKVLLRMKEKINV